MTILEACGSQAPAQIDLNADMGESYGVYRLGQDEALLQLVTSANIACGFHAGDASTIRVVVEQALAAGVAIGAHPGLPDRVGFGRRAIAITPAEAFDMTLYQVGALYSMVRALGGSLRHVKPHGALYNMAAEQSELADAIAQAAAKIDDRLVLVGLAGSELLVAAHRVSLPSRSEVFADRGYAANGRLLPRSMPGALIEDVEAAVNQGVSLAVRGVVVPVGGEARAVQADTICIHGDGRHAEVFARSLRTALEAAGVTVTAG